MARVFVILVGIISASHISIYAVQKKTPSVLNSKAGHFLSSQPDSAFFYATEALRLAIEQSDLAEQGNSHQIIGKVFFQEGVYLQSLDHLQQADALFREINDNSNLASNLNQQGLVLYNVHQPERALEVHQEALALYESLADNHGIAFSLGCIGRLYEKKQDYAKSLEFQKKALTIYESIDDKKGTATILEHIGSILEDQESHAEALEYFEKSLHLSEATGDSISMIINLNNIGDNYRKTGKYDMAVMHTQQALAIAKQLNNRDQLNSAYKDLGKEYYSAGSYKLAYENLDTGRTIYEEIFAQDASQQLALVQTLFELERKNNAIQQLKNAQYLDTVIKISLAGGILLIAIIGGITISRQRLKIKKDEEEILQNQKIYETKNKLMQAELENTHLRETTLQQELDMQSKSLTTHTLHILGKNRMLEDIQRKLTELQADDREEQRRKIKSVVKMIEHNFVQDKDWDDFGHIFRQVHKDFFEKLSKVAPDLTSSDLRLASLIRLNLSSQDISSTLGISVESLRMARYRLKKKLCIENGQTLSGFIHGLG